MLDYCSDDLRETLADASCTSRAQERHVPKKGMVESLPVMSTHFAKPETDREHMDNLILGVAFEAAAALILKPEIGLHW